MCSSDLFHVLVRFLKNPNDAYAFDVYKGGCAGADNICGGVDLFEFFTDFHNDVGPPEIPGGECKCKPDPDHSITAEDTADDTDPTTHACTDQSSVYYVRVYRLPGAVVACDDYQIEFSNGIAVQ